jgi:hypothetical protein
MLIEANCEEKQSRFWENEVDDKKKSEVIPVLN